MKIILKAKNMHWLGDKNTEKDLCLHGNVEFSIGEKILSDEKAGDWSVSTASFNLLKTVNNDYSKSEYMQLIPCCGHSMFLDNNKEKVVILGCNNGINWNITHNEGKAIHSFDDGEIIETSYGKWAKAVGAFSDEVMEFYEQVKREPHEEDEEIFRMFIAEWKQLRAEIK